MTGTYGVMEAYPTPTPTPPPPPPPSSGPTPTPSPIPINVGVTANPASPQPAGTVRITVGSNYNDPGAWSISVDGTFLAGQLSNSYGGGPRGSAK